MKPLPSEYKILREIYDSYYEAFANYKKEERSTKIYVPVDLLKLQNDYGLTQIQYLAGYITI